MRRRSLLIRPDPHARFLLPSSSLLTWMRQVQHEEGRVGQGWGVGGGICFYWGIYAAVPSPFCHLYKIALLFAIRHFSPPAFILLLVLGSQEAPSSHLTAARTFGSSRCAIRRLHKNYSTLVVIYTQYMMFSKLRASTASPDRLILLES